MIIISWLVCRLLSIASHGGKSVMRILRSINCGLTKKLDMCDEASSLKSCFNECQDIVESVLQDKFGVEKNNKVLYAVKKLEEATRHVEDLSLFSLNDDVEELPTSSLKFLLLHAYLAYCIEETHVDLDKRATNLSAAKVHYRQFLQNLLVYRLIDFKLPWLQENECDDHVSAASSRQKDELVSAANIRAEKIARLRQREELEATLAKLRLQQRQDGDEATERETVLVLIRLWAIRVISSLSVIEDELKILEFAKRRKENNKEERSTKATGVSMKPFIIAKSEAQKEVFGLGYPSVPTYTVDEWYDQMSAKQGFGRFSSKTTTINGDGAESSDDGDADDEATREAKRQKAIRQDEWRDTHRRGWGNTHNKG